MKYKFLGIDKQKTITLRGIIFDKGKPVVVESEALALRLANLDYFAEVKKRKPRNDKDSA